VGGIFVSIVRIGLSENKGFGDGYDAIFGKKKEESTAKKEGAGKSAAKKKKKPGKKK
jgi:hypothetical protein